MKAELSNALSLESAKKAPAQDAPRNVDKPKAETAPQDEIESSLKRKFMPESCEKAYSRYQETLKKYQELKIIAKKWQAKHDGLLATKPSSTQRLFAKIGLGTAKIERYDLELSKTQSYLSKIERNKKLCKKILIDKKSLSLIEQYNAIIDHNTKISEAEAQAKMAHASKLERERGLAEEQAWKLSEPIMDWTIGCDPTKSNQPKKRHQTISEDFSFG